ncbi:MAG TPA: nicotinate-nucleotide--dimethylbenzimidazole phosphoribosyltransferase, partial [Thermodesulfobacteriota bacterium]
LARLGPRAQDPLAALAEVGGLEIAALAGFLLGAAAARLPVVLDGVITGAAALAAARLVPAAADAWITAHRSPEPAHGPVLDALRLRPLLDLEMRLGEGSGACLGLGLVTAACRMLREMATFEEAEVSEAPGEPGV